ncbi:MAG: TonB family protein [Phenylobacterium sp.]|uniref:TonB family protein n=1 Tax=Phenylobacterium sp. TaxID=1871053 RepID=UPI002730D10C|nr:energy transducer TonB [Phenylobacterium sp.]MDP2011038.1 TonB family protein [Phenylobacterium sp.]
MGLAALAVAGAARADPPRVSPPEWLVRPDGEDLADSYPGLARALSIEGRATISCAVDVKGRLQDCVSPTASPPGLGFDKAALEMSKLFAMRPKTMGGAPVAGGTVRIPIRFTLPPPGGAGAIPEPFVTPAALDAARRAARLSGIAGRLARGLAGDLDRIEADGADPMVRAQGLAALTEARRQASPQVAEAVARSIAAQLSPAEVDHWVSHMNSPGQRKLAARGPELARAFAAAQATHTQIVLANARETFCGRQDCHGETSLADMRALAEAPEAVIDKPRWSHAPSLIEARAAYPLAAQAFRLSGWAMLQCRVTQVGGLEDCKVVAQGPRRLGFGAAGLKVAGSYRLDPDLLAQGAAGDRVNLPTIFSIERGAPPTRVRPLPSRALTLAREIVRTQGVEAKADHAADLGQWLLSHQLGLDSAVARDAGEAYRGAVIADLPNLLDAYAAVYATTLTEPELASMAAFLHSRAGHLATGRDDLFNIRLAQDLGEVQRRADAQARTAFCAAHLCAAD